MSTKNIVGHLITWIRDWFNINGPKAMAVIGISGGKDSTICAKLLIEALGKDRVFGVQMPRIKDKTGEKILSESQAVCDELGLNNMVINIDSIANAFYSLRGMAPTSQSEQNLLPRIRMTMLYYVAQGYGNGGRVCNTCNLCEDAVGYSTIYGDEAGDFALLKNLTVHEVIEVGKYIGIREDLVMLPPSDGLCGKTDEDNLGFKYEELHQLLRYGTLPPQETLKVIVGKIETSQFKRDLIHIPAPQFDLPLMIKL